MQSEKLIVHCALCLRDTADVEAAASWAASRPSSDRTAFAKHGETGYLFTASEAGFKDALARFPSSAICGAIEYALSDIHCMSCIGYINDLCEQAASSRGNPIQAGVACREPFDRAVFFGASSDPAGSQALNDAAVALLCDKAGKGAAVVGLAHAEYHVVELAAQTRTVATPAEFVAARAALRSSPTLPPPQPSGVLAIHRVLRIDDDDKRSLTARELVIPTVHGRLLFSPNDGSAPNLGTTAPDLCAIEFALADIHCMSCIEYLNSLAELAASDSAGAIYAGVATRAPFDRMVVVVKGTDAAAARRGHQEAVRLITEKAKKGAAVVGRSAEELLVVEGDQARLVRYPSQFAPVRAELRKQVAGSATASVLPTVRRALRLSGDSARLVSDWALTRPAEDRVTVKTTEANSTFLYVATDAGFGDALARFPSSAICGAIEYALSDIHCMSCIGYINDLCEQAASSRGNPIQAGVACREPFDRAVFFAASSDPAGSQALNDAAVALICDKAGKGAAVLGADDAFMIIDQGRVRGCESAQEFKTVREAVRKLPLAAKPASPALPPAARHSTPVTSTPGFKTNDGSFTPPTETRSENPRSSAGAPPAAVTRELFEFVVDGMSCASCAGKIEVALLRRPFVDSAAVNFATCTATVTIKDVVNHGPADVVKIIEGMGFHATPLNSGGDGDDGAGAGADDAGDRAARQALTRTREIHEIRTRLIVAVAFTLPLVTMMIASMSGEHLPQLNRSVVRNLKMGTIIQFCLATPVVVWCGKPFFVRAWLGLKSCSLTMDTLVAFGVGGSYTFSVGAAIAQATTEECHVMCYFDTAGTLLTFMLLGKYLEAYAKRETGDALVSLMNLSPPTTILVAADGTESVVPSGSVPRGAKVKVLAGSRVPVDGIIVDGHSSLDESMLTGEPFPVDRQEGDTVIGGTMNLTAAIIVEARKVGGDTMLAHMARIVRQAQSTKPQIQRVADKAASVFVPAVVTFAVLVFLVWLIIGQENLYPSAWRGANEPPAVFAFSFFLATVVVACPCALGLATPTAVMVGTGIGARCGVLIKTGESLETAPQIDCILFDKTGTLTKGEFHVARLEWLNESALVAIDPLLRGPQLATAIALAESASTHPIARTLQARCNEEAQRWESRGVCSDKAQQVRQVGQVRITPGGGLAMDFTIGSDPSALKHEVVLGNPAFVAQVETGRLASPTVAFKETAPMVSEELRRGRTVVVCSVDGVPGALFSVEDTVKMDARESLNMLRTIGAAPGVKRRIMMVTGDNESAAREVASRVGIRPGDVYAHQRPEDKVRVVAELQEQGFKVAFVGDGINDSAALAKAELGVALGAGTEVALDAADIILVHSHLSDIVTFFDLSAATMRRIRVNFAWAVGYNMAALPVASGMLYPLMHMQLPPVVAGIAMVCSSLSVLASSLSLKCFRPTPAPAHRFDPHEGLAYTGAGGGGAGGFSSLNGSGQTLKDIVAPAVDESMSASADERVRLV
jgi:Cu+-exporting ATPase